MRRTLVLTTIAFLLMPHSVSSSVAGEDKAIIKSLKALVVGARYNKAKIVLKYVGVQEMSQDLLGPHVNKVSKQQRDKFNTLIEDNVKLKAIPKLMEYFKDIDVPFGKPQIENGIAKVKSSVVWEGKERANFTWVLKKVKDTYVVTDIIKFDGRSYISSTGKRIRKMINSDGMDTVLSRFEKALSKHRN